MSKPKLQFWLSPAAKSQGAAFASPRVGDAGFDLRLAEAVKLPAGKQILAPTGLHLAIPLGWVGLVRDRSSRAIQQIYTHAGVIDASYRGEVKVVLENGGPVDIELAAGEKVAQMVVVEHLTMAEEVSELEALGSTDRGAGGFGSTGTK
jgi:dUTP pyrophosphatase